MSKQRSVTAQKICIIAGAALLLAAALMLALWRWNISSSQKQAQSCVDTLRELIPMAQDAIVEERGDNTMSVLSVDGTDFVGIIEIPRYSCALPVGAKWGKAHKYPCLFSGSIYEGSIQIGATTQEGQFDFYRLLSVGDKVVYTDMEGNRYTFQISSIYNENHADQKALQRNAAGLTLFIKNIYSFEYLVVFCDVAN